MFVGVVNKHQQGTPILEFHEILLVKQDQRSTTERHYDAGIGERFPVKELIGCGPNLLSTEVGGSDIVDKYCHPDGSNPHP